jgi:hypothetical protein
VLNHLKNGGNCSVDTAILDHNIKERVLTYGNGKNYDSIIIIKCSGNVEKIFRGGVDGY